MTAVAEPSTYTTPSRPLLAHIIRFLKNYVLRFFLITTLVTALIGVVFLLLEFLESYLYPDGTQSLVPDTIVLILPAILICLGLFLRLRHPNAKVERADAIMYAIIFAVLLVAGSIAFIASGANSIATSVVLWVTAFPYAPSIVVWAYAFGLGSSSTNAVPPLIIAAYIPSTLAFAAITSWILSKKKGKKNF